MSAKTFDPNAAADGEAGVFGLPHTPDDARVVLLPVPWDATTSYGQGAAEGPNAIFAASMQVDLFDVETGRPYEAGIAMLDESSEIRAWNVEARASAAPVIAAGGRVNGDAALVEKLGRVNALSRLVNERVYEITRSWLARGKLVGVVGGDHATPLGAIRAHAEKWPELGVLHVDAHADLRRAYEGFEYSHASIMECVMREVPGVARLVQVAVRDLCEEEQERIAASAGRIHTLYDVELARARMRSRLEETFAAAIERLPRSVYVSFDIDGLDPVLCPNTGTPVPGGLSFQEANALLRAVVESGRTIVGFDLNEVAPAPGGEDEWDGNVGARVLYKLIGWALKSSKSG